MTNERRPRGRKAAGLVPLSQVLSERLSPGHRTLAEVMKASVITEDAVISSGGSPDSMQPDVYAWWLLGTYLECAAEDRRIAAVPDVAEFLRVLSLLLALGPKGGAEAILRSIGAASPARAGAALKASGDDTRERVLAAWLSDVDADRPERGRCPRIARALHLPETTVRSAVSVLRKARLLPE